MSKEVKKSNVKELPGLNGNAYSASRYLYTNIKKRPLVVESKKQKKLNEKITYEFDDNGGIIVLSTDVNAQQLSQNKLMNWIKKKVATLKNRVSADKNIKNAVLNNVPETGWTVGKYLRGRYHAADGSDFDENSLSVELLGLPTDVLVSIAEDLCNEFKQESVIVKDYNKNKVYIVNGEKEVKEESMNEDYWQNTSHSARVREYEDGTKELYSYGTLIATIKPDGDVELTRYWDYSRTTGQHLRDFLRKYGIGNYGASKDIYNDLIRKRKVKTDNIELRKASALDNAIECIRFGDGDKDECDWCGLSEKDFDEIWKQAKKEVRELNKKKKNNTNKKEDKEMKEAKYTQRPEKLIKESKDEFDIKDYLDIELEDDNSGEGGIEFEGETVRDFIGYCGYDEDGNFDVENADEYCKPITSLKQLNKELKDCGIKPLKSKKSIKEDFEDVEYEEEIEFFGGDEGDLDVEDFISENEDWLSSDYEDYYYDWDDYRKGYVLYGIVNKVKDLSDDELLDYIVDNFEEITGKPVDVVYNEYDENDDAQPIFDQDGIDATSDKIRDFLSTIAKKSDREIDDLFYKLDDILTDRLSESCEKKSIKEGRAQIYQDMEDEYFDALAKAEKSGNVEYCVLTDTDEECFGNFKKAVEFAKKNGVDEIEIKPFTVNLGYNYFLDDYDTEDYKGVIVDLDMNIIDYLDESCKSKKLTKKVVRESKANKNNKK